jgi:putative cell wall-binding protein
MDLRKVWRRVLAIGALTALAVAVSAGVAYADTTPTATFSIQGHIGYTGGDWAGSAVSAVPYSQNASGTWIPYGGSQVATDGTYSIDGLAPGTYRVCYTDSNRVYADRYYDSVDTTIGDATDIAVSTANVTGIDQTVTALPALQFAGTVHLIGAALNSGDIQAEIYSQDASGTWNVVYTAPVADDGTYDIHVTDPGDYRIGFDDTSNLFDDVFYGGSTIDSATTLSLVAGTPQTGLDVTMTATASTRWGGSDPVSNALALSQANYEDGHGGTVIICTADNWTDALAAAPLAHALDCPILLVHKKTVDQAVLDEIDRLQADEAIIIGGTSSVSLDDEFALRSAGCDVVRRLDGADRYGTSVAIAQEMLNRGLVLYDESGNLMNVAVASGASAYNALLGAPVAADQSMPLLIIQKASVPTTVKNFLAATETSATQVTAFGTDSDLPDTTLSGTAIAPPATTDMPSPTPLDNVYRIGDTDVFHTSVLVTDYEMNELGWSTRKVMLASNKQAVDLVAAAPYFAAQHEGVLLTAPTLKKKKVAGIPKPYYYTYLTPCIEAYVSKTTSPSLDAVAVTGIDPNTALGRIDALGANSATTGITDDVWKYALTLAQIPH